MCGLLLTLDYSCGRSTGKVPMRSSQAVAMAHPAEAQDSSVDELLRTLAGLIEALGRGREGLDPSDNSAEEVLLDTEVDGARYLLLRMRPQGCARIQLSPREQEIVRMVAKGHPNKVIADVLNISSWTVCTHLRRIFAKLGVSSRAAMVAQLLKLGVFGPEHRMPPEPR
jgi:DNA-binding CsgD family transcriptional regulator